MGPLEIMYGWQAVICAIVCTGCTQFVKVFIDTIYEKVVWKKMPTSKKKVLRDSLRPPPLPQMDLKGNPKKLSFPPGAEDALQNEMGTAVRKQSVIITRFVLPMTPIFIGIVYANLVPLLPEILNEYLTERGISGFALVLAKGAWGGSCGQFANYAYDRLKKTLEHLRSQAINAA